MSDVIFARVQPDEVHLRETYRYEQTLGRTNLVTTAQAPSAQIQLVVSYDGYQSFTRQAYADVRRQVGRLARPPLAKAAPSRLAQVAAAVRRQAKEAWLRLLRLPPSRVTATNAAPPPATAANAAPAAVTAATPPHDALMGHLLFDAYARTDLESRFGLYERYGALPLRVPLLDDRQQLIADHHVARITFDYTPQELAVKPVQITAQVDDDQESLWPDASASQDDILAFLNQTALTHETQNGLRFAFRVEVNLPTASLPADFAVTVKQMALEWPLPLSIDHQAAALLPTKTDAAPEAPVATAPLKLNPLLRRLEWGGIPLRPADAPARPDLTTLTSEPIHLLIRRPADLYQVNVLNGQVEIELPGLLLSGVQAFYFDSIGRRLDQVKLEKKSRLLVDFKLTLNELFAQRAVLHFRQAVVPQVTQRSWRLSELDTHLADSGFRLTRRLQPATGPNERSVAFGAEPMTKPQSLQAWVVVNRAPNLVPAGNGRAALAVSVYSDVHIHLHCLSRADHVETALALNRLQTALTTHFEQMSAEH